MTKMVSFCAVDEIGSKYANCELELISLAESLRSDEEKETVMVGIPLKMLPHPIYENDILLVEHDGENIITIYGTDKLERQRREERNQKRMEKLKAMMMKKK